ncbi:hypothetical protein LC55x_5601 [Lysobacter capsici]|nr:hypothetical protein LC55x_5601 [Lysobacter capsici]
MLNISRKKGQKTILNFYSKNGISTKLNQDLPGEFVSLFGNGFQILARLIVVSYSADFVIMPSRN